MNCRNSDLPDTAMAPSCDCGRSLSDISGPGPVVRPVVNFCFDDNDPRFPIGMGYVPMMIYIILPQTFKIIAPQIGNTFVANIKDTSVLNVIAVTELFYITKVAAGTYFRMFEAYTITALIYLTLTLLFNGLLKLIEKYMAGKESYEVLNPAAAK